MCPDILEDSKIRIRFCTVWKVCLAVETQCSRRVRVHKEVFEQQKWIYILVLLNSNGFWQWCIILGITGFFNLAMSNIKKCTTFRKLDAFPSLVEMVGGTYFVGSVRKSLPQSLDNLTQYYMYICTWDQALSSEMCNKSDQPTLFGSFFLCGFPLSRRSLAIYSESW